MTQCQYSNRLERSMRLVAYAKIARKVMLAGADGVYTYGLVSVCPLITPGVGVAVDISQE